MNERIDAVTAKSATEVRTDALQKNELNFNPFRTKANIHVPRPRISDKKAVERYE